MVLFVHVIGILALFVALTMEWLTINLLQAAERPGLSKPAISALAAVPRFTAVAVLLILTSGIQLASQVGVLRSGWVGVSFGAMVIVALLGVAALRPLIRTLTSGRFENDAAAIRRETSRSFVRASLRIRISVALAIVYLMIAKPDAVDAAAIAGLGLVVGILISLFRQRDRVEGVNDGMAAAGGSRWS